jgi:hypothetical protein
MRLREILERLQFEEQWGVMACEQLGYRYKFGNVELTAVQVTSLYLRPIFLFGGVAADNRSITEVSFEMPIEVESFEQGVAWIAYGVGNAFVPIKPAPWLVQGRAWEYPLPWERDRKAYQARPHCVVERDWWRLGTKKMRELALKATGVDLASFSFDGDGLRIKMLNTLIVVPAEGKAWDCSFFLKLQQLDWVPKRLMQPLIEVSAWKGQLHYYRQLTRQAETA